MRFPLTTPAPVAAAATAMAIRRSRYVILPPPFPPASLFPCRARWLSWQGWPRLALGRMDWHWAQQKPRAGLWAWLLRAFSRLRRDPDLLVVLILKRLVGCFSCRSSEENSSDGGADANYRLVPRGGAATGSTTAGDGRRRLFEASTTPPAGGGSTGGPPPPAKHKKGGTLRAAATFKAPEKAPSSFEGGRGARGTAAAVSGRSGEGSPRVGWVLPTAELSLQQLPQARTFSVLVRTRSIVGRTPAADSSSGPAESGSPAAAAGAGNLEGSRALGSFRVLHQQREKPLAAAAPGRRRGGASVAARTRSMRLTPTQSDASFRRRDAGGGSMRGPSPTQQLRPPPPLPLRPAAADSASLVADGSPATGWQPPSSPAGEPEPNPTRRLVQFGTSFSRADRHRAPSNALEEKAPARAGTGRGPRKTTSVPELRPEEERKLASPLAGGGSDITPEGSLLRRKRTIGPALKKAPRADRIGGTESSNNASQGGLRRLMSAAPGARERASFRPQLSFGAHQARRRRCWRLLKVAAVDEGPAFRRLLMPLSSADVSLLLLSGAGGRVPDVSQSGGELVAPAGRLRLGRREPSQPTTSAFGTTAAGEASYSRAAATLIAPAGGGRADRSFKRTQTVGPSTRAGAVSFRRPSGSGGGAADGAAAPGGGRSSAGGGSKTDHHHQIAAHSLYGETPERIEEVYQDNLAEARFQLTLRWVRCC